MGAQQSGVRLGPESVAVITGAGSGIGRQLAVQLAARGVQLSLCDINMASLTETKALCKPVKTLLQTVDTSKRAEVEAFALETRTTFDRVDVIFNNAGIALGYDIESVPYEEFERLFGVNFWGVVYGTKAFLPDLKQQSLVSRTAIVNISSIFGIMTTPRNGPYCASKFAVKGFTESLRQEIDQHDTNILVVCVHPGGVKTNVAKSARGPVSVKLSAQECVLLGLPPGSTTTREELTARFEQHLSMPPEKAAGIILSAVRTGRERCLVGMDARFADLFVRAFPSHYWKILLFARTRPRLVALLVLLALFVLGRLLKSRIIG